MFKVRKIVSDNTKLIRNKSKEVTLPLSKEDEELCEYLIEHLRISQNDEINEEYGLRPGVGIAACQVGEFKKIFAMLVEMENETIEYVFVNGETANETLVKQYEYN